MGPPLPLQPHRRAPRYAIPIPIPHDPQQQNDDGSALSHTGGQSQTIARIRRAGKRAQYLRTPPLCCCLTCLPYTGGYRTLGGILVSVVLHSLGPGLTCHPSSTFTNHTRAEFDAGILRLVLALTRQFMFAVPAISVVGIALSYNTSLGRDALPWQILRLLLLGSSLLALWYDRQRNSIVQRQ